MSKPSFSGANTLRARTPKTEPETTVAAYLRVSTDQQEHDSQKRAVDAFLTGRGLTAKIYTDKASGKTLSRHGLDSLQKDIFCGRIRHVIFYSIDRFSRELVSGLMQIENWAKQGIRLTFLADGLDLDGGYMTDIALRLIVSIRLAMAEGERQRIRDRTRLGLACARAKGVVLGRPTKVATDEVQAALAQTKGDKRKAAKRLGCSLSSVYNAINRDKVA